MSTAKSRILSKIQASLEAGDARNTKDALQKRLEAHSRNLIPARASGAPAELIARFRSEAEKVDAAFSIIADLTALPRVVAEHLRRHQLPAVVRLAPHPDLENLPWTEVASIEVSAGRGRPEDAVGVGVARTGVAETGTLIMASGPNSPTTLNFLPDDHIVVLHVTDIVGAYEQAWDILRADSKDGILPRAVNMITGPSRTADIEQTLYLGAHGPRRLHIVIVDPDAAGPG